MLFFFKNKNTDNILKSKKNINLFTNIFIIVKNFKKTKLKTKKFGFI